MSRLLRACFILRHTKVKNVVVVPRKMQNLACLSHVARGGEIWTGVPKRPIGPWRWETQFSQVLCFVLGAARFHCLQCCSCRQRSTGEDSWPGAFTWVDRLRSGMWFPGWMFSWTHLHIRCNIWTKTVQSNSYGRNRTTIPKKKQPKPNLTVPLHRQPSSVANPPITITSPFDGLHWRSIEGAAAPWKMARGNQFSAEAPPLLINRWA